MQYNPDFLGVYACDDIPEVMHFPCSIIVNTDKRDEPGNHWVALYLLKEECLYFDSFGVSVLEASLLSYLKRYYKKVLFNKICIQPIESTLCGFYCISFVQNVSSAISFNNFLLKFDFVNLHKNDNTVLKLIK